LPVTQLDDARVAAPAAGGLNGRYRTDSGP